VYFNKLRNLATSIFFSIYSILFIIVPIILHCFYGGAKSIVADKDNLITNFDVYLIYNILGIVLLSTSLFIVYNRNNIEPNYRGIDSFSYLTNKIGLLIVFGLFVFIYSTGLSLNELFSISRFGWMESSGYNVFFSVLSTYIIALTPIYIYLFIMSKKNKVMIILFILCLISLIVYSIITKDRKSFFYIFSGLVAAKYHQNECYFNLKRKYILFGFLLLMIFVFSQFIRDFLPRYILNENIDFWEELYVSSSRLIEYSDISYFYRASIEAIYQNYENNYFIFMGIIRRTLFFYLPSSLSGGLKIEDMSAIFSDLVGGEDNTRRGSMPPGFFGIFVLSFGWFVSILIMPIIAYAIHKMDMLFIKKISVLQIVFITLYFTCVVFVFRGDESTSFYFIVSNIFFLFLIKLLNFNRN
jgi:hypothetical protein